MDYFYILRSLKTGKLYLGRTSDLQKRLDQHNTSKSKATKPYAPYELLHYSAFKHKTDAINAEKYYKTTAGWKRIKKMLESSLKEF